MYPVPPVAVEVSMDYGDPLYAGTNLTLTCSTDLDENLVDIPVVLNTSWTRNNVPVIINSTHSEEQPSLVDPLLLTYTATYSFTPLDDKFNSTDSSDMGDSGAYQCNLTVMADVDDPFVRPTDASDTSDSINVLGEQNVCRCVCQGLILMLPFISRMCSLSTMYVESTV